MKKSFIIAMIITVIGLAFAFCLTRCNKQIFDTTYRFDTAILIIGNDVITIEVDSWKDYADGDQIQVKDKDGNVYLVHSSNCTLIKSASKE